MASTSKCPYCGATVRSDEASCPNCGAPNELFVVDTPRTVFQPKTIEELQEYCAERGMPLLRMRFFIGEDFKEPRAFGIYRDGEEVVVYKNKADGSRSIRYQGNDEAHGVRELYQKLLEECHNRGIYPDGRPKNSKKRKPPRLKRNRNLFSRLWSDAFGRICLMILAALLISFVHHEYAHSHDGYYRVENDNRVYYHYGSDWYYSYDNYESDDWFEIDVAPIENYRDYSLGGDWDSDWGVSDFKDSSLWDSLHPDTSSVWTWDDDDDWDWDDDDWDWDSWDSNDTDWDSDW